VKPEFIATLLG
jgi:hypothetical protein